MILKGPGLNTATRMAKTSFILFWRMIHRDVPCLDKDRQTKWVYMIRESTTTGTCTLANVRQVATEAWMAARTRLA